MNFIINYLSFIFILLILSGDIETNPGPDGCYSLRHPNMFVFLRTAIYLVFVEEQKLIFENDDALVPVDANEGFMDFQNLFKQYFEAHLIVLKTMKKNISRFKDANTQ